MKAKIILIQFAIFLILAEIIAQGVLRNFNWFPIEMWKYQTSLIKRASEPEVLFEHKPDASGTFMGAEIKINSSGCRGKELEDGKNKIIILGDSMTLGWGVEEKDSFVAVTQMKLDKQYSENRYNLVNSGVAGYNTAQELAVFKRKWIFKNPKIVILSYFINDAEDSYFPEYTFASENLYSIAVLALMKKIYKANAGNQSYVDYYNSLNQPNSLNWKKFENSVKDIEQLCAENKIPLIIMLIPELHQLNPYPFQETHDNIKKVTNHKLTRLVDLAPLFSKKGILPATLWVSRSDVHPNALGHRIIADELFNELQLTLSESVVNKDN